MGVFESSASGRRYRLLAELARGGMGQVFVGQEVGPRARGDALVAVKTLLPDTARDAGMLARFVDEAQLTVRLDHPGIAAMQDFGLAAERPFAVFELLDGADLGEVIDRLHVRGAQLPVAAALAIAIEAAGALEHAHRLSERGVALGVVHRDLSPSNLFLTREGRVKVLDFGAAWHRERLVKTATGNVIGKLEYMSPEQVRGQPLDARSDLFALGLCLQELLTLRRPYASEGERELVEKVYHAQVPPLAELRPGLPGALCAAVRAATEADRERRPSSAAALAELLRAVPVRPSTRAELAALYGQCFGAERSTRRAARLAELAARPRDDDGLPFAWEAPPLYPGQTAVAVAVGTSDVQESVRAQEPETDREGPPPTSPATKPDRPMPRTAVAGRTPARAYVFVAAAILLALVAGILIGRAGGP